MAWLPLFMRLAVLSLTPSVFAIAPDGGLSIEELRELARQRRTSLRSLAIRFFVEQHPPADQSADVPFIAAMDRSLLIDCQSGRYKVDRTMQMVGDEHAPAVTIAFDGDVESLHIPYARVGTIAAAQRSDVRAEGNVLGAALINPPQPNGMGVDDGSLESFLLHAEVAPETEVIDGSVCAVIHASREGVVFQTVWLDLNRDLLPIRRVGYGPDGLVNAMLEVKLAERFEEPAGAAVWLPVEWTTWASIRDREFRSTYRADPDSIEINPAIADDRFSIAFPPGTIVTDEVLGAIYAVGPSGEHVPFEVDRTDVDPAIIAREWAATFPQRADAAEMPAAGSGAVQADDDPPSNPNAPNVPTAKPHAAGAAANAQERPSVASIDPARPDVGDLAMESPAHPTTSVPAVGQWAPIAYLVPGAALVLLLLACAIRMQRARRGRPAPKELS